MSERSWEKGADVETKRNGKIPPKWVDGFVYALILVLVVTPLLLLSLPPLIYLTQGGSVAETDINSADRVLSFLQGASVLIGGAVAVAAIYGFRNAQEVRKELREEQERIKRSAEELRAREEKLGQELQEAHDIVATLQVNTAELSEAYHNLLHRNYQQAFDLAQSILRRDPTNITALYLSGWLSIQFIKGRAVDEAISDLEKALRLAQEQEAKARLPMIKAALGVAYRRKGKQHKEQQKERDYYFSRAEAYLLEVTRDKKTERMLDLYAESFYAPLGGLYRDRGWNERAIECYKRATEITPGSSYPWGNLAQLLWQKGEHAQAIKAFERTYRTALREQGATPEDYYHLMDLAMSATVLGKSDKAKFKEAERWLEEALATSLTDEMLSTSLSGWEFLLKSCPEGEDWDEVREHLQKGRDQVQTALAK